MNKTKINNQSKAHIKNQNNQVIRKVHIKNKIIIVV